MNNRKIEVLTDIPESKIDAISGDYRASGANIKVTRQPNGLLTLEAEFTPESRYQATGTPVLK